MKQWYTLYVLLCSYVMYEVSWFSNFGYEDKGHVPRMHVRIKMILQNKHFLLLTYMDNTAILLIQTGDSPHKRPFIWTGFSCHDITCYANKHKGLRRYRRYAHFCNLAGWPLRKYTYQISLHISHPRPKQSKAKQNKSWIYNELYNLVYDILRNQYRPIIA